MNKVMNIVLTNSATGSLAKVAQLTFFVGFLFSITALAADFRSAKGGVQVSDMTTGSGLVATEGMVATIHFTGWLDDQGERGKTLFDTRDQNNGAPISFVIGTDKVMPAWNEGVLGMQAGGKRLLLVPPKMAYGNRAINDVVPANASLQFVIELVRLEN